MEQSSARQRVVLFRRRFARGYCAVLRNYQDVIADHLEHRNANPKPYKWTAAPDAILDQMTKAKQKLETSNQYTVIFKLIVRFRIEKRRYFAVGFFIADRGISCRTAKEPKPTPKAC